MNNLFEDKVYYNPGDLVTIKHDLPNKPVMMVVEKITRNIINKSGNTESTFIGIKCRWFDKDQRLEEAIFSTKDLVLI